MLQTKAWYRIKKKRGLVQLMYDHYALPIYIQVCTLYLTPHSPKRRRSRKDALLFSFCKHDAVTSK